MELQYKKIMSKMIIGQFSETVWRCGHRLDLGMAPWDVQKSIGLSTWDVSYGLANKDTCKRTFQKTSSWKKFGRLVLEPFWKLAELEGIWNLAETTPSKKLPTWKIFGR